MTEALDGYADRIAACRRYGLEPVITLHHFTHPAWLGLDAWLSADIIDRFADYVQTTVAHINHRLIDHHQLAPIHWYITLNEPNILVSNTYLSGQFPTDSMLGIGSVFPAYNHLLAAHVRAYNLIHDLYEAKGWTTPRVSLNTYCSDLYWSEKVIWDLLSLRLRSVDPVDLQTYVYANAQRMEAALRTANLSFRRDLPYQLGRFAHWFSNRLGRRNFDARHLGSFAGTRSLTPRSSVRFHWH